MSLHAVLKIGTGEIGWIEILRVTNTGVEYLSDDTVSEYEVYHQFTYADKESRRMVGKVSHTYGAGAYVLLSKAAQVLADAGC